MVSIFDGKIDSENVRYVITGNHCELSKSNSKLTDCVAVHYEIQDLKSSYTELPNLDYTELAQIWGLAFTSVLTLWLFSHGIGQILKMVRNG